MGTAAVYGGSEAGRGAVTEALNIDCMEYMRSLPDKAFDLAVVDPPYYENAKNIIVPNGDVSTAGVERRKYKMPYWIPPTEEYFLELERVSEKQIIFGINYFPIQNPGPGRIVWDKVADNGTYFSDCEIAYCSIINHVEIFRPEYWALMLKWDSDSPVTFKADGHTVHDFDRRFQAEGDGMIAPDDKVFRWDMLDAELNYRLF